MHLASARYDPAAPNVLGDALGRAHDITMVTNTERRKAAAQAGRAVRIADGIDHR